MNFWNYPIFQSILCRIQYPNYQRKIPKKIDETHRSHSTKTFKHTHRHRVEPNPHKSEPHCTSVCLLRARITESSHNPELCSLRSDGTAHRFLAREPSFALHYYYTILILRVHIIIICTANVDVTFGSNSRSVSALGVPRR